MKFPAYRHRCSPSVAAALSKLEAGGRIAHGIRSGSGNGLAKAVWGSLVPQSRERAHEAEVEGATELFFSFMVLLMETRDGRMVLLTGVFFWGS